MIAPQRPRLTAPATVFAWAGVRWAGTLAEAGFALDALLGDIVRTTTQPIVGQMRLTWWYEALRAIDSDAPRAHPVLQALAQADASGAMLAGMVDGWERLLEPDAPDDAALADYADERGGTLFVAIAQADTPALRAAGRGWALADLAANVADGDLAERARGAARIALEAALGQRWPAASRGLGALAIDARAGVEGRGDAGSPGRAARVLRFRLSGR